MKGQNPPRTRKPLVWAYPEYGGQVAVRIDDFKILRRGLHTKKPGDWEVYDIAKHRGETINLAAQKTDLLEEAKKSSPVK